MYWLPPIPPETIAELSDSEPAEERRWGVTLTGYEIDEMDPFWRETGIRGAVRYD
jgi:hypothetical protein